MKKKLNDKDKSLVDGFSELCMRLNIEIIKETGGTTGEVSKGNLDFCVWRSLVFCKKTKKKEDKHLYWASALLRNISQIHPFKDGNKRTSYIIAKLVLLLNDESPLYLDVPYKEAVKTILKIARKKIKNETEIIEWMRKHSFGISDPDVDKKKSKELREFIKKIRDIITK